MEATIAETLIHEEEQAAQFQAELVRRIDEARAAGERIAETMADAQLAATLPDLRAELHRSQEQIELRRRIAEASALAKAAIPPVVTETVAWRKRVLDLVAQLDEAIDELTAIQRPLLEAHALMRRTVGRGLLFEQLWLEAGGYTQDLAPDFGPGLLTPEYRRVLQQRQRSKPVYRPRPAVGDPLAGL